MKTITGIELIAAERSRQVAEEGWTPEHDEVHESGEMAKAAACYALPIGFRQMRECDFMVETARGLADPNSPMTVHSYVPLNWPWAPEWWKPTPDDRIRELTKAGALIAAEIDRLQRIKP